MGLPKDFWRDPISSEANKQYKDTGFACVPLNVNNLFNSATQWMPRRDPLTLDLDDDGIETVSSNSGITFDFDGDGLKTGTGWIKGDDGLLVLDRNANGMIENGAELFGEDTLKSDGTKATNGFDALSDLDSNLDGVFDSQDTEFSNVRVWQDVNQNGISEADELRSLSEHNIVAINLDATAANQTSNGNLISAIGTFVRGDGSESSVTGNTSQAANLDLASNPFFREFTNEIPLDSVTSALPTMQGSGAVRDLREASMLNPELKALLGNYASAQTRPDQIAMLDNLMNEWGESSGYRTFDERISQLNTDSHRFVFAYSWEVPQADGAASGGSGGGTSGTISDNENTGPTAAQLEKRALFEKIKILEAFNSQDFFNFNSTQSTDANGNQTVNAVFGAGSVRGGGGSYGGVAASGPTTHYITESHLAVSGTQAQFINSAYQELKDSIYQGLLLQTRLKPYLDEIDFSFSVDGLGLDYTNVTQLMETVYQSDQVKASVDLYELIKTTNGPLSQWSATLGGWLSEMDSVQQDEFKAQLGAATSIVFGETIGEALNGGDGSDFVFAEGGNDTISGNEGNDFLSGGSGDDSVYGNAGFDILRGEEGADRLYGNDGDDILDGGSGNDQLSGGNGSDTYLFGIGSGNDTINNYDRSTGRFDVVLLGEGLYKEDVQLSRSGNNLLIKLKDHSDSVSINEFFYKDAIGGYQIDRIQFADGQSWSLDEIKQIVLLPAEGLTQILGYDSDDIISGSDANEDIYGSGGNDSLAGGGGSDRLDGGHGSDVLDGGAGNDHLSGGNGSDTYLFGFGSGHDVVNDYDVSTARFDRILLGAGVTEQNVSLTRTGDDLVLSLSNGDDSIRISSFFRNDAAGGYQIDQLDFADGAFWNLESIKQIVLQGTQAADRLTGYASDDVIDGGAGDDLIEGAAGDDSLIGGFGDDTLRGGVGNDLIRGGRGSDSLSGGTGSDTYFFARGDGRDRIDNYDTSTGRLDVLQLDEGITQADVRLTRSSNNHLVLTIKDTGDTVSINGFFYEDGTGARILDRVAFADGTFWDVEQLKLKVLEPSDSADTLYGYVTNDVIDGGAGNDRLVGNQGDDLLIGGADNDRLEGGAGDDSLDGGTGDDYLTGGEGSDTYLFGRGSGQDVINNFDRSVGSEDVIQIAADILPSEIQVTREGNHLAVRIQGSNDVLRVEHFFESDATDGYQIDKVVFANGTIWDVETVKQLVQQGTGSGDILYGYATDDIIDGLAGDDQIYGSAGNDHLSGGDGVDRLFGEDGNDTLLGGAGDDYLSGGAGDNLIDGQAGNDVYRGGENDTYVLRAGSDHDRVSNLPSEATIKIEGYPLDQLILRRNGTSLIASFISNSQDSLTFDSFFNGNVPRVGLTLQDGLGNVETLDLEALNLRTLAGSANDDHIQGNALNNVVAGGAGSDHLEGLAGDDDLSGDAGDDLIQGGLGNDSLAGGHGNDELQGGQGDDHYIFALGSGLDTINDASGNDTLTFTDALPSDVVLRRDDNDLVITRASSGDQVRVEGQFSYQAGVHGTTPVESLVFADGTSWDASQIKQMALAGTTGADEIVGHTDDDLIHAGAGDDVVHAENGSDEVHGGEGNDTLNGDDGNDVLFGDAGNDTLNGDWGDDQLHGGDGDDILRGGGGSDSLYGDAGADHLYGNGVLDGGAGADHLEGSGLLIGGSGDDVLLGQSFDTLRGGEGDDLIRAYSNAWDQGSNTIEGGEGNDTIYGSFGEDTYVFNLGDGQDLLIERRANEAYSNISPTADTLVFGEGITASDLSYHRNGLDMHILHANGTDSIIVQNWFKEPNDHFKLENFVFDDGVVMSQAEVEAEVIWHGTSGEDSFIGYRQLDDHIRLGEGNDQAWGRAGDDTIHGELGNDYLEGEAGNDSLYGGAGNDQLSGGTGDDLLAGGTGDDKYVYTAGDGADVIDNVGGGYDGVFFNGGIGEDRLAFNRDGNDLLILVDDDAAQSVRVLDHFLGGEHAISYVQPSGGYMLMAERIGHMVAAQGVPGDFEALIEGTANAEQVSGYAGRDMIRGLGGNDTLFGMGGDDQVEGGDGNDYLSGGNGQHNGSGDDVLIGGAGNDVLAGEDGNDMLAGGAGDDSYYYRSGGGVDVIDNQSGGFDGVFFLDVAKERLSFHQDGDDLVILVDGDMEQQVRVTGHFLGSSHSIDYVQPDGGYYLTTSQIAAQLTALPDGSGSGGDPGEPTDPGDPVDPVDPGEPPVAGIGGDDQIIGTSGDDILLGGAGNDTLTGNSGNDSLLGGIGNDTYVYSAGKDVLTETQGTDTLLFSNGITFNQVASGLMKSGDDLVLRVGGSTTNQVTLKAFFLGGDNLVETISFETGGQITAAQIFGAFGMAVPGAPAGFANTVQGSTGDDASISGTSQNDLLQGFNGDDVLSGGAGADRLEGGNGADTLSGGSGNDILLGGRGNDTYVFTAGDGQDVIDNSGGGTDTLHFEGISFNQAAGGLMKSGNDLVLNIGGGSDKVTIRNWFLGGDNVVDTITFASGGQITSAQLFGAFGLSNPDPVGSPDYQNLPDERQFGTILSAPSGSQSIFGSSDSDLIDGGAGNDTLRGNAGNDYLIGGSGSDTYAFASGDGQDVINNLSATAGTDTDLLSMEGLAREDLWLSRDGDDLVIDALGS